MKPIDVIYAIGKLTARMCAAAGLQGHHTNHSGKRTCTTTLYQAGIPKDLIMQRSGHRSVIGKTIGDTILKVCRTYY